MKAKIKFVSISLGLSLFVMSACTTRAAQPVVATAMTNAANIANPASTYCKEQGNRLELRTAADGSRSGVCVFPDGSQCDEWAYFKGECTPETQAKAVEIVRSKLASQLNVEPSSLGLVSVHGTTWSDACLGIEQAREMCAQVATAGFRITLASSGKNYTLRTNLSASVIRQEPS